MIELLGAGRGTLLFGHDHVRRLQSMVPRPLGSYSARGTDRAQGAMVRDIISLSSLTDLGICWPILTALL
jgi:hypothetical protein